MPKTADLLEEIAALKALLIAADARDKRCLKLIQDRLSEVARLLVERLSMAV